MSRAPTKRGQPAATTKLWDRGTALEAAIERFTVGKDPQLDQHLLRYDALASGAHAKMLARIGVVSQTELAQLLGELWRIVGEAETGRFDIPRALEDGHTAIENRLTATLGEAGKRIHTGRSRNDQVIAALRLYGRQALLGMAEQLLMLSARLIELAQAHKHTSLPGYTHTRQAMPSTLGLLFSAHAAALLDLLPWIKTGFEHLNRSPLGSASGYGVALPLDRPYVAELLAFDTVQENTLAVQNDRGRSEFLVLSVLAAAATDLGRLAGDLILFSSDEFGFIKLADDITTGSSIMPQKRNPDVLELARALAARLRSRVAEVGGIYGPLTSGYHRDLQLTKAPFVESLEEAADLLAAFQAALSGLTIDSERCRAAVLATTGATDEVYRRVAEGTPFRDAYKAVASDPAAAVAGLPAADRWQQRPHLGAPGQLDFSDDRRSMEQWRQWHSERQAQCDRAWTLFDSTV